jgi:tetratricopeptide (TPR) repeat protein
MRGNLGIIASKRRDFEKANSLLSNALSYFRSIGDDARTSRLLNNLVAVAIEQEELDTGLVYLRESLAISQRIGDTHGTGVLLHNMGEIALRQNRLEEARRIFADEWRIGSAVANVDLVIPSLQSLGHTLFKLGDYEASVMLFAVTDVLRKINEQVITSEAQAILDKVRQGVIDQIGEVAFEAYWRQAHSLRAEDLEQLLLAQLTARE